MLDGLTYEHPIERISMEGRQLVEMKDGAFIERERRDPMSFAIGCHKVMKRAGKRQFAQGMLDRDFPHRYRAEQNLVGGIDKHLRSVRR